MSQPLFYYNLPDSDNFLSVMQRAYYNFLDILSYLYTAQRSIEAKEDKISWEEIIIDELLADEEDAILKDEIRNSQGFWVQLDDSDGEESDSRVFDQFLGAKEVFEKIEHKNKAEEKKLIHNYIKILNNLPDKNALLLEKKPQTKNIFVKPSTYQLNRQIKAINLLQNKPHPLHRPLLRLIEHSDIVSWPPVNLEKVEKWDYLPETEEFGTLEQKRFVEIALNTPDFAILEGPPGSGKTTAICELISQLIKKEKRVLLCASTHIAVDNVLERIIEDKNIIAVRIGDRNKILPTVRAFQIDNLKNTKRIKIIKFLTKMENLSDSQDYLLKALQSEESENIITNIILESANLICGTTLGILQHPEIKKDRYSGKPIFDYLIIDEASKTTFQEFLVPALLAEKWIIVGDPKQLSPYVETSFIETNLENIIDVEIAQICYDVFQCKNYGNNALICEGNDLIKKLYMEQSEGLGLKILDLDNYSVDHVSDYAFLSSSLIIGSSNALKNFEDFIPMDLHLVRGEEIPDLIIRRRNYWLKKNKILPLELEKVQTWSKELAFRLVRSYELRKTPNERDFIEKQIENLIPVMKSIEKEKINKILKEINNIRRIALPSIIELLKEGFERNKYQRSGCTLTDGFNKGALEDRAILLTYQHRMHPEISRFPREFIYDNKAIKDPEYIKKKREWKYANYPFRSIWIQVYNEPVYKKKVNINESSLMIKELKKFIAWAQRNRHPENKLWEIAFITFYRAQERELRKKLRGLFRSRNYANFKIKNLNINLFLATVDRFQGHEADIVFLSFVQNRRIGFLNSINRLNVAITRPKFQLVLVGDCKYFQRQSYSKMLQELANNNRSTIDFTKEEEIL